MRVNIDLFLLLMRRIRYFRLKLTFLKTIARWILLFLAKSFLFTDSRKVSQVLLDIFFMLLAGSPLFGTPLIFWIQNIRINIIRILNVADFIRSKKFCSFLYFFHINKVIVPVLIDVLVIFSAFIIFSSIKVWS